MFTNIDALPLGNMLQVKQGDSKNTLAKKKKRRTTVGKMLENGFGGQKK